MCQWSDMASGNVRIHEGAQILSFSVPLESGLRLRPGTQKGHRSQYRSPDISFRLLVRMYPALKALFWFLLPGALPGAGRDPRSETGVSRRQGRNLHDGPADCFANRSRRTARRCGSRQCPRACSRSRMSKPSTSRRLSNLNRWPSNPFVGGYAAAVAYGDGCLDLEGVHRLAVSPVANRANSEDANMRIVIAHCLHQDV